MSDDRQVRFYQISLTGGQMLAAFFVSILLLGGAFALGFSAARSAGRPAEPVEVAPPAATAEPAPDGGAAAETAAEAPTEPIASLGEIAVEPEEPAAGGTTPAPATPASAVASPKGEPEPPPAAKGKSAEAVPPGESKPAPKGEGKVDAKKIPASGSAPPAKSGAPAAKSTAPAAKPADGAPNGWTVQVAALGAKEKAEALRKKLAQRYSTTVVVVPMKVGGKNLFAVRVGKYKEKSDAEKMASRLRGAEKDLKETRVVPR